MTEFVLRSAHPVRLSIQKLSAVRLLEILSTNIVNLPIVAIRWVLNVRLPSVKTLKKKLTARILEMVRSASFSQVSANLSNILLLVVMLRWRKLALAFVAFGLEQPVSNHPVKLSQ